MDDHCSASAMTLGSQAASTGQDPMEASRPYGSYSRSHSSYDIIVEVS
jgi:hypothetical protein